LVSSPLVGRVSPYDARMWRRSAVSVAAMFCLPVE
jgi:hypothetical protein